jgi:hypothetical protein
MKNLILDGQSVKLVQTVLKNEIYLLEFNLKNGAYFFDEKETVIQEINTLNNVIEQLKQD